MGLTMGGLDVRQSEVSGAIRDEHRGKQTGVEGGGGEKRAALMSWKKERKRERERRRERQTRSEGPFKAL